MNKPLCIYHGNCADGFTAAWAVWKRFGDTFDYHAGVYQQPPPDTAGRDVVLVDFSYKREVMLQLAKRANGVLVLDPKGRALLDTSNSEIQLISDDRGEGPDGPEGSRWDETGQNDVFFIAEMRNATPQLIATVQRYSERIKALEAALGQAVGLLESFAVLSATDDFKDLLEDGW